jgi:hypothetical protein
MKKSNDAAEPTERPPTLEERIEIHLKRTQADTGRDDDYVDLSDRERVKRRALISAALDAIFEHGFHEVGPDGIEVEVNPQKDVWSDLAIARQDFQHDEKLLGNGEHATGCLRPVGKESITPKSAIDADRELMIIWLAVIELWDKDRDASLFTTHSSIRTAAARATAGEPATYKTNRSNITKGNRFNPHELKYYHDLIAMTKAGSITQGGTPSPFQLLYPAAMAKSAGRLPKKVSAENLKG